MKKSKVFGAALVFSFAISSAFAQTTPTQSGTGNGTPASQSVGQNGPTQNGTGTTNQNGNMKSKDGSSKSSMKSSTKKSSKSNSSTKEDRTMPTNPGTSRP